MHKSLEGWDNMTVNNNLQLLKSLMHKCLEGWDNITVNNIRGLGFDDEYEPDGVCQFSWFVTNIFIKLLNMNGLWMFERFWEFENFW